MAILFISAKLPCATCGGFSQIASDLEKYLVQMFYHLSMMETNHELWCLWVANGEKRLHYKSGIGQL